MNGPHWASYRDAAGKAAALPDADEHELLEFIAQLDEAMGEPFSRDLEMHDEERGAANTGSHKSKAVQTGRSVSESGAPEAKGSTSNGLLSPTGNFKEDLLGHTDIQNELSRIQRNKERRVARAKEQEELAENAVAGEPSSQSIQATSSQIEAQAHPRPRYELYQISALYNGPAHEGNHHLPGYTNTPAVQCYLEYDRGSYKLGMDGRPRDWPAELYTLSPSGVERVGDNIQKRFTVWTKSDLVFQVELYHDEDVEELMGFLRSGAVGVGAIR